MEFLAMTDMAAKMPDDARIRPSVEVAQRHAAEDRAAVQAELEAAREMQARIASATSGPVLPLNSSVRKTTMPSRRAGVGPNPVAR